MRATSPLTQTITSEQFVPVDLRYFVAERPPLVDLYVRIDERDPRPVPARLSQGLQVVAADGHRYARYCDSHAPLSRESRTRLLNSGYSGVYCLIQNGEVRAGGRSLDDLLALTDADLHGAVKATLVYEDVVYTVSHAFTEPGAQESVDRTARCVETLVRHLIYSPNSLHVLIGLVRHEASLFTHCANVCIYATSLARIMSMPAEAMIELATGALVHDVGMMRVPTTITGKPGPLTPEEREVVRKHPKWGADLLSKAYRKQPGVLSVVLQHHERADGAGYPSGLTGEQMTQFARIVGVIDKYEAITSDRPYRPAMHPYKATQAVREELVGQFEQELFVPMLRMVSGRR